MRTTLLALLLVIARTAAAADAPAPAAKWHIDINGQAATDGQMQFRVTPHEGEAITVTVDIKHGRPESFVTKDVSEAFKAQLSKKRFKSDVVSEKVLLRAGPAEGDFTVELVGSTVEGTRIHVTAN
jgi:hypothetical protein